MNGLRSNPVVVTPSVTSSNIDGWEEELQGWLALWAVARQLPANHRGFPLTASNPPAELCLRPPARCYLFNETVSRTSTTSQTGIRRPPGMMH